MNVLDEHSAQLRKILRVLATWPYSEDRSGRVCFVIEQAVGLAVYGLLAGPLQ